MLNVRKPIDSSAIESNLKLLTNNSKILNQLTDELTKYVEQVESAINALNLGLTVSVIAEAMGDLTGVVTHYVRLGYYKQDGRWGLCIDEYDQHEQDPDNLRDYRAWAFKDAPRVLRLKVVDKIPDLMKALAEESEKMTAGTAEAVARAIEITESLPKKAPNGRGIDLSKATPAGSDK
jgi:hypothetical protein